MSMFDDTIRDFFGPADYSEPEYNYINRSARPEIRGIRETLEDWYSHIADSNFALQLYNDFKSRDDRKHIGAVTELYTHELFSSLGFGIEYHPDLGPEAEGKRPDYRIFKGSDPVAIVECVTSFDDEQYRISEQVKNDLFDRLNLIQDLDYYICVRGHSRFTRELDTRAVARAIGEWCNSLDIDDVGRYDINNDWPKKRFEDHGQHIEVSVTMKGRDARGHERRNIGIAMSGSADWVNDYIRIRRSLKAKASKYGRPGIPYLIVLNPYHWFVSEEGQLTALWGHSQYAPQVDDETGERRMAPAGTTQDGFFNYGGRPIHQRVSGIVFLTELDCYSIGKVVPVFHSNPFSTHPFDHSIWPFSKFIMGEGGSIQKCDSSTPIGDVMSIGANVPR